MEFSHVLGKQMNWNGMITFRGIVVPSRQLRSRTRAIILLMRVVISAALLGVTPRTIGFFCSMVLRENGASMEIEYGVVLEMKYFLAFILLLQDYSLPPL